MRCGRKWDTNQGVNFNTLKDIQGKSCCNYGNRCKIQQWAFLIKLFLCVLFVALTKPWLMNHLPSGYICYPEPGKCGVFLVYWEIETNFHRYNGALPFTTKWLTCLLYLPLISRRINCKSLFVSQEKLGKPKIFQFRRNSIKHVPRSVVTLAKVLGSSTS